MSRPRTSDVPDTECNSSCLLQPSNVTETHPQRPDALEPIPMSQQEQPFVEGGEHHPTTAAPAEPESPTAWIRAPPPPPPLLNEPGGPTSASSGKLVTEFQELLSNLFVPGPNDTTTPRPPAQPFSQAPKTPPLSSPPPQTAKPREHNIDGTPERSLAECVGGGDTRPDNDHVRWVEQLVACTASQMACTTPDPMPATTAADVHTTMLRLQAEAPPPPPSQSSPVHAPEGRRRLCLPRPSGLVGMQLYTPEALAIDQRLSPLIMPASEDPDNDDDLWRDDQIVSSSGFPPREGGFVPPPASASLLPVIPQQQDKVDAKKSGPASPKPSVDFLPPTYVSPPQCRFDKTRRELYVTWKEDSRPMSQRFSCKKLGKETVFQKAQDLMVHLACCSALRKQGRCQTPPTRDHPSPPAEAAEETSQPTRRRLSATARIPDEIAYAYDGPFSPTLIYRKTSREWMVEWTVEGIRRVARWSCKKLGKSEAVARAERFVNLLALGNPEPQVRRSSKSPSAACRRTRTPPPSSIKDPNSEFPIHALATRSLSTSDVSTSRTTAGPSSSSSSSSVAATAAALFGPHCNKIDTVRADIVRADIARTLAGGGIFPPSGATTTTTVLGDPIRLVSSPPPPAASSSSTTMFVRHAPPQYHLLHPSSLSSSPETWDIPPPMMMRGAEQRRSESHGSPVPPPHSCEFSYCPTPKPVPITTHLDIGNYYHHACFPQQSLPRRASGDPLPSSPQSGPHPGVFPSRKRRKSESARAASQDCWYYPLDRSATANDLPPMPPPLGPSHNEEQASYPEDGNNNEQIVGYVETYIDPALPYYCYYGDVTVPRGTKQNKDDAALPFHYPKYDDDPTTDKQLDTVDWVTSQMSQHGTLPPTTTSTSISPCASYPQTSLYFAPTVSSAVRAPSSSSSLSLLVDPDAPDNTTAFS